MLSREQVLELLKSIQEPTLQRSLVELNLVRDMMIREQRVNMSIILVEPTEQASSTLKEVISQRLSEHGVEAHIRFRQMTDKERSELTGEPSSPQQRTRTQSETAGQTATLLSPDSSTKFIAVASGKGGVGKSTVTVNLAVALARLGVKVGVIDADIYGFSVPDMMGIEERPELKDNKIIPIERFGVKVISMGFFVEDNAPIIWRGPMLGKMLRNFFHEVEWGELDIVLLDLPPGTGDIALDVHQMIPHSKEIIVTTPHATAAFVAARAGSMALTTGHEIVGVVENMAYYQCTACSEKDYVFGKGGGAKLAEQLNTELLAQIPLGAPDNHPQAPDYSPSVYAQDTSIGQMYLEIAERVMAKLKQ